MFKNFFFFHFKAKVFFLIFSLIECAQYIPILFYSIKLFINKYPQFFEIEITNLCYIPEE